MDNASSDHVHRLIRSMTGSEKRYFKVYTSRQAPGSHREQQALFDAFAALQVYDEQFILGRFKGKRSLNQFTTIRHRLYDAVLRSLHAFHMENSIDARMARTMHQVEILYARALYLDAERLLASARRLAKTHDRQVALLGIHRWEQRLLEHGNYANADPEKLAQLLTESQATLEQEQELNRLWALKSRIFLDLYRSGQARDDAAMTLVASLLKDPLLQDPANLRSPRARFLYHHAHSAAAFATGAMQVCTTHLAEALSVLETNRPVFIEEPNLAISTLSNLIYMKVSLGRSDEAFELLRDFRLLPGRWNMPENEDLDLKLFATSTSLELSIHTRLGHFDKALELQPVVERGMAQHAQRLSPMRKASFYYQMAYANLGAGRPDQALRWGHRLLNDIRMDESAEIISFGRMLHLLAHVDADKLDLLSYTLRNTSRLLSTRKRMHRFEPLLLNMIRGVIKARDPVERKEVYQCFRDAIVLLETDPFERLVFDHLDPIAWVDSKLTGKPFAALVQARSLRVQQAA